MGIAVQKLFEPVVLGVAAAAIYSAPSTSSTIVVKNLRVRLVNVSGAAASVTLYAVPSGGSVGAGNNCLDQKSIPGHDYLDVDIPSLKAGDTLQGLSSVASVITVHEIGGNIWS